MPHPPTQNKHIKGETGPITTHILVGSGSSVWEVTNVRPRITTESNPLFKAASSSLFSSRTACERALTHSLSQNLHIDMSDWCSHAHSSPSPNAKIQSETWKQQQPTATTTTREEQRLRIIRSCRRRRRRSLQRSREREREIWSFLFFSRFQQLIWIGIFLFVDIWRWMIVRAVAVERWIRLRRIQGSRDASSRCIMRWFDGSRSLRVKRRIVLGLMMSSGRISIDFLQGCKNPSSVFLFLSICVVLFRIVSLIEFGEFEMGTEGLVVWIVFFVDFCGGLCVMSGRFWKKKKIWGRFNERLELC